ncbi:uncharacterized protein MONOS_9586 [Monocercomonoides exilis]|uniref:uncharacterized protein n=1 Tax=Monocercomonoides exilis TaxID=2049356 RepID=UPI00355A7D8D|nr:hypothetical protein MONOS_9586 [Monocercomonoides exilis]|eukprot:MONOS_9586.1-p1 / transcript=MONOS_9586.1 / gene=MONOS_9586 / organism=Monocercomonoides_exilis_PA203 / gene_product=unspecified product / transcript_product=unspecified product / location=Mono_scaffold00401:23079-24128(+) / protein_length=331 / sequence_SO=supercontig / SO=protein_coding / is_pseudo=false
METFEEEQKKEEENEKLLADLCECFLLLNSVASSKLLPIWVRRLLKVALNKEESEETQNEVELALLALSIMAPENEFEKELYLNDITEIIKHHQEHHNLTHLGYQSAWGFLITRFHRGYGLEPTVVDKLHFAREATKELEELMRRLNWKKNERELEKSVEFNTIKRWMKSISVYTGDIFCVRNEEEHIGLTACVAKLYDAAKCNKNSIYGKCTWFFLLMSNSDMWIQEKTDVFAKSGAVERVLDCVCWETFEDNDSVGNCFYVFTSLCDRLESAEYRELDYAKWKIKRKIFEKLEEGGYEDIVTSFIEVLPTDDIFYNFSHDIKDYLLFI